MPCFKPIDCWPAPPPAKGIVYSPHKSFSGARPRTVPCSRCLGCRLDKKRERTTRLMHERQCHEEACFVTLTLDAEHYPASGRGDPRHIQLFMKRLRKAFRGIRIRYYAISEFGERTWRLHYHALLYGVCFSDRVPHGRSKSGHPIFTSPMLDEIWQLGHAYVQDFTLESAKYCAGYSVKKIGGEQKAEHYRRIHPHTGELVDLDPEFAMMSLKPGIGLEWFEQYASDCFPKGFVTLDGKRVPVPSYYRRKWEEMEANQRAALRLKAQSLSAARREADLIARGLQPSLATREEFKRIGMRHQVREMADLD